MRQRRRSGLTPRLLRRAAALPALAAVAACGEARSADGWTGTRARAGDTAVVVTRSGYVVTARAFTAPVRVLWKSDAVQQVAGIAVLGDSLLAVADLDRIHLVSADGRGRGTVGRPGDGPGEFRSIHALAAGDGGGLLVWDGGASRLTWLDLAGRVSRTLPVAPPEGYASPLRVDLVPAAGGVALAWSPSMLAPNEPSTIRIVFHPLDGRPLRELAAVRSVALVPVPALRAMVPREVYGPMPLVATGPDGTVAVSDGTAFRIDVRPAGGRGVLRLEQPGQGAPLSRCEREPCLPELRREVTLTEGDETFLRERMQAQRRPRRRSRLDALVFDDQGVLWVRLVDGSRRYDPMLLGRFPELRPPTYAWELFARDGRRLATVRLDSRFEPRAFAGARVFGTYRLDTGEDAVAVAEIPPALRTVPAGRAAAGERRGR